MDNLMNSFENQNPQIFMNTLNKYSVSILTQPNNHLKAYVNSPKGRIEFLNEITYEPVVEEVMEVWGDTPTVEDDK